MADIGFQSMNLKDIQEKQHQARVAVTHYNELVIKYVEISTFTGKELLDMIRKKQEDPGFETDPYMMFAGILMEVIKEKEASGTIKASGIE